MALAGDHEVGALEAVGQADETGPRGRSPARCGRRGRRGRRPGLRRRRRRARSVTSTPVERAGSGPRPRRGGGRAPRPVRRWRPSGGRTRAAASRKGVVTSQATTSSTPPSASGEPTASKAPSAAVGGGRAAAADDDATGPGVAGGQQELSDAGRAGATGSSPRGCGTRARPAALDISITAVRGRVRPRASSRRHSASTGWPSGPVTVRDAACAAERVEQALAAVGHGYLVGRPAGPAGRARRPRPRGLGRRRGPPEFVRRGDEVGHAMRRYPDTGSGGGGAGERTRTSTPSRGPGPKPGASANSATPAAVPQCG